MDSIWCWLRKTRNQQITIWNIKFSVPQVTCLWKHVFIQPSVSFHGFSPVHWILAHSYCENNSSIGLVYPFLGWYIYTLFHNILFTFLVVRNVYFFKIFLWKIASDFPDSCWSRKHFHVFYAQLPQLVKSTYKATDNYQSKEPNNFFFWQRFFLKINVKETPFHPISFPSECL